MEDESSEMPQYICCGCLRKLKSSYSFIKQARKANDKFLSLLNGMGESNIDIPPCLEIKMEYDDDDEEPDCSYENSDSNCGLALKVEASNENPLSEDIKDTKQNSTPELININM